MIHIRPSKCDTCELFLECLRNDDLYKACATSVRGGDQSQVMIQNGVFNVIPSVNECTYCHFNNPSVFGITQCPMEAIIICDDGDKIFRSVIQ